jgi:PEGA domain
MLRGPLMRLSPPSLLFALAAALGAPLALADSAPASPPVKKPDPAQIAAEKLADLVKRGAEHCAGGDLDQGLAALNAAWAQHQDPDLAVTLASCEMKAELWPAAAEHLAFALRNKDDPEQRKPLETSFTAVRARVGAVKVTVTIDGADVFVGDRYAGQSPLPAEVYIAPGDTRIFAKKTGYGEIEGTATVRPQGTTTLTLDLAGQGAVVTARHITEPRSVTPAYVLGGLGVVAAGVGAVLYATGASKGSAADELLAELQGGYGTSPCSSGSVGCTTLKSLRSSHDTFINTSAGVFAGSGALVGTALLYGLWATFAPPPERDHTAVFLAPSLSPAGGGGLFAHGTF